MAAAITDPDLWTLADQIVRRRTDHPPPGTVAYLREVVELVAFLAATFAVGDSVSPS